MRLHPVRDRVAGVGITSRQRQDDVGSPHRCCTFATLVIGDVAARSRRIGATLVDHAAAACFALGFQRAYLCARRERTSFYENLGWTVIEREVGPNRLGVFIRDADSTSGTVNRSPP